MTHRMNDIDTNGLENIHTPEVGLRADIVDCNSIGDEIDIGTSNIAIALRLDLIY